MANSKYWNKDGTRTKEYKASLVKQITLWRAGVSWHNKFSNECTPDFSCCRPEMLTDAPNRVAQANEILAKLHDVQ
jgi:hypothetical protein